MKLVIQDFWSIPTGQYFRIVRDGKLSTKNWGKADQGTAYDENNNKFYASDFHGVSCVIVDAITKEPVT